MSRLPLVVPVIDKRVSRNRKAWRLRGNRAGAALATGGRTNVEHPLNSTDPRVTAARDAAAVVYIPAAVSRANATAGRTAH